MTSREKILIAESCIKSMVTLKKWLPRDVYSDLMSGIDACNAIIAIEKKKRVEEAKKRNYKNPPPPPEWNSWYDQ